jgi:hypothetical protein
MRNRRDFIKGCSAIVFAPYPFIGTRERQTCVKVQMFKTWISVHAGFRPTTTHLSTLIKSNAQDPCPVVEIAPTLYSSIGLRDFLIVSDVEQQRKLFLKHIVSMLGLSCNVEPTYLNIIIDYMMPDDLSVSAECELPNICRWEKVWIAIKLSHSAKDTRKASEQVKMATFENNGYKWMLDFNAYNPSIHLL